MDGPPVLRSTAGPSSACSHDEFGGDTKAHLYLEKTLKLLESLQSAG